MRNGRGSSTEMRSKRSWQASSRYAKQTRDHCHGVGGVRFSVSQKELCSVFCLRLRFVPLSDLLDKNNFKSRQENGIASCQTKQEQKAKKV